MGGYKALGRVGRNEIARCVVRRPSARLHWSARASRVATLCGIHKHLNARRHAAINFGFPPTPFSARQRLHGHQARRLRRHQRPLHPSALSLFAARVDRHVGRMLRWTPCPPRQPTKQVSALSTKVADVTTLRPVTPCHSAAATSVVIAQREVEKRIYAIATATHT